jgi:hypothetical protein
MSGDYDYLVWRERNYFLVSNLKGYVLKDEGCPQE